MPCAQTLSNLFRDCAGSVGGVAAFYYANKDDVTGVTVTDGIITAIALASSKNFYTLQPPKQTSSLESTWNVDEANGSKYVESTITVVFNRMETAKRVAMQALAEGEFVFIVKDKNGKFWYLGKDDAVTLTGGTVGTGTAYADRNGYSMILSDQSAELPYEVDGSIIDSLLAA